MRISRSVLRSTIGRSPGHLIGFVPRPAAQRRDARRTANLGPSSVPSASELASFCNLVSRRSGAVLSSAVSASELASFCTSPAIAFQGREHREGSVGEGTFPGGDGERRPQPVHKPLWLRLGEGLATVSTFHSLVPRSSLRSCVGTHHRPLPRPPHWLYPLSRRSAAGCSPYGESWTLQRPLRLRIGFVLHFPWCCVPKERTSGRVGWGRGSPPRRRGAETAAVHKPLWLRLGEGLATVSTFRFL